MQRSTNGSAPACASCRHQRKRCTENCILARFFPAEKTREFQAVHKIFGVSNATKIVKDLNVEDGKRAVDSLVWEALCRLKDPVLGPYGEYRRVYEELNLYKTQYQQQIFHHHHHLQLPITQGGVGLVGWNTNNNKGMNNLVGGININSNNKGGHVLEYINNNGGITEADSLPYTAYSSLQNVEKVRRQDQNGSVILPQQHSMNGFNEKFH